MNPIKHTDPWEHWIADDVIHPLDFSRIQEFTKNWPKPKTPQEKFNLHLSDFKFYKETIEFVEQVEETKLILTLLAEDIKQYWNLGDIDYRLEYACCGGDYLYRPHIDAKDKVLSNVIYISEKGNGTRLFKEKMSVEKKELEWKPNRMMTFARKEDVTWHDYYSTIEGRVTFNISFLKNKIREIKPQHRWEDDLTLL